MELTLSRGGGKASLKDIQLQCPPFPTACQLNFSLGTELPEDFPETAGREKIPKHFRSQFTFKGKGHWDLFVIRKDSLEHSRNLRPVFSFSPQIDMSKSRQNAIGIELGIEFTGEGNRGGEIG